MSCLKIKKNLGLDGSCLPQMVKGMIETPASFSFTATQAIDPTQWQAALLAISNRIFIWPPFDTYEEKAEAAVYEETPLSVTAVRQGRYGFMFGMSQSLCLHKAMFSHSGKGNRVFLIDLDDNIIGTQDTMGNVMGFLTAMINVEKLKFSDGAVSTKTPVYVVLRDHNELDKNGVLIDGSGFVTELASLVDVAITKIGAATTSKIVVSVTTLCAGINVGGLIASDFVLTKQSDGTTLAITSLTQNTDGSYNLNSSGAAFVAANLTLKTAATLSIPGYEAQSIIAISIP